MDLDRLPRKCYFCNTCKKFKISVGNQLKCELCGHHKYMHEQFTDIILQEKLEEAKAKKSILDTNSIPKKCYKCNECQMFYSLSSESDICLVCGHNEGEHEQFIDYLTSTSIFARQSQTSTADNLIFNSIDMPNNIQNIHHSNRPNIISHPVDQHSNVISQPVDYCSNIVNRHHFSQNINHHSNISQNINNSQNTSSELVQFLSDNDARIHLMDLRDEVNIRELAQSYNIKNKNKRKKSFSYSPTVFLLRKTKNNKVPIPGHPKFTRLYNNGMVKIIQFEHDDEYHIHQKIVSAFPILRELGWVCVKPDSKNNLHPYKVDAAKTGKLIKSAATTRDKLYIAPIRKNIKLEDGYLNSASDTDEEPIISTTKSKSNEDPIIISDDEVDIRVNTLQNANYFHRVANATTSYQNHDHMDDENSLSVNEFRLNMLNKLRLEYHISEESFILIIIHSRSSICDDILNWINNVTVYNLIKNPIIDILDEE
ncbi:hypothetical protein GLOIN_2v1837680 [Rhizophagus clarus]|uniref:Uncharacterized protein n=1 Tax=Rhizophagus clarus TaxID=94130 RepID=A0A8H3M1U5_9GLOM|nr:hypothetical protein GLOIN_2v1837680 [Rhizophagus clarus]